MGSGRNDICGASMRPDQFETLPSAPGVAAEWKGQEYENEKDDRFNLSLRHA
jgi:hypothetical protein